MNQVISSKVQFKIIPGICIPERISRISSLANVCFIAVNQRIERIGKQNFVGFTKAYGTTTKNHIYGDVVDLCNSVPTVREIQGGEPHFLLFLMKGLDNSSVVSVVTIFDTAASYSLFKEDILGTKIKATPVSNQNGDLEERVGGIGGSVTARNYLALLPVLGGFGEHEHQLTVCQSVQNIVSLKNYPTTQPPPLEDSRIWQHYQHHHHQDHPTTTIIASYGREFQKCANHAGAT